MYKVLIVEDEHLIRKWLTYTVDYQSLGFVIIGEAENGKIGEEMIRQLKPDIVLTDINMPVYDAFTMFENTKDIPYQKIILSGYNDFLNAKKALQYGVRNFITKPIVEEELYDTLVTLISEMEESSNDDSFYDDRQLLPKVITKNSVEQEIVQWIHQHYAERFTIAELAYDLGYSESYIYKCMKEHLGITINDYLSRYRIKIAIYLIQKEHSIRVYELAEKVGFSDYNYFNKVFKKYMGMTITEFKDTRLNP
jgi:two-component system response regulator YesN